MVCIGKVEVCKYIGFRISQKIGCFGIEALYLMACWVIEFTYEFWDAQVDDANVGYEGALAVSVPLAATGVCALCLRIHDFVRESFRHDADGLMDVDHPIIESRHVVAHRSPLL